MTTQKTTKITEAERVEALPDIKKRLRSLDPNIGEQELQRRANLAAGLAKEGDQPTAAELEEAQTSVTRKAARKVGEKVPKPKMPTGQAQKLIFGVMLLIVSVQIFNDIIVGRNRQFDVIPRRIFAASLAGILLMLLAVPIPKIAVSLSIVMGLITILTQSDTANVLAKFSQVAGGKTIENEVVPPPITRGIPS